jgi:hypothetical protein
VKPRALPNQPSAKGSLNDDGVTIGHDGAKWHTSTFSAVLERS